MQFGNVFWYQLLYAFILLLLLLSMLTGIILYNFYDIRMFFSKIDKN